MQLRVMCAVVVLCAIMGQAVRASHPEHYEPDLVARWVAGGYAIEDGKIEDMTHTLTARVLGNPAIVTIGPMQAVSFDGLTDWLKITDDIATIVDKLPRRDITVSAWVMLRATEEWGGIFSAMIDNGSTEYGWILGYDDERFTFAVSTEGADDGDGVLTYLRGKTDILPGRWYHVAGTYDGAQMKLYVNGMLDGASVDQSGDILYPALTPVGIGAYVDTNELNFMSGALYEVRLYKAALSGAQIKAAAEKGSNAIAWEPPQSTSDLSFLVTPYLQFATKSSITIMCETSRPTRMTVEYGERIAFDNFASAAEPRLISELTLDGLSPQTHYLYRVICRTEDGHEIKSEVLTFQTAVHDDAAYAFTVIGDTQRNPAVTGKINQLAYALRPNFQLHCGDLVDDGHSKSQWIQDLLVPSSVLMSHVPMYPVIGNHEKNSRWYYDYFALPTPENRYTFTFGNAEFFMIDSNQDLSPAGEQYKWLEAQLARSTAVWKFTVQHHPCFSSDNNDHGDTMKGPSTWGSSNARHVIPLFERYGVDIAFNGHIHVYERTWPIYEMRIDQEKGIRYITSGGAGGGLEKAAPQRTWFSLHFNPAHHFCYVTIHGKTIQFKAYDIEGRLFDVFEMTKP
jgi:predicted phosphodiesterase